MTVEAFVSLVLEKRAPAAQVEDSQQKSYEPDQRFHQAVVVVEPENDQLASKPAESPHEVPGTNQGDLGQEFRSAKVEMDTKLAALDVETKKLSELMSRAEGEGSVTLARLNTRIEGLESDRDRMAKQLSELNGAAIEVTELRQQLVLALKTIGGRLSNLETRPQLDPGLVADVRDLQVTLQAVEMLTDARLNYTEQHLSSLLKSNLKLRCTILYLGSDPHMAGVADSVALLFPEVSKFLSHSYRG